MCVRNSRGISVLELLIAVAIVAVLATAAIPAYSAFQQTGNRISAFDSLQELADKEMRYYSRHGTFTRREKDLGYATNGWQTTADGLYEYQVNNATATQFNAIARVTGDQSGDSIERFRLRADGSKHHKLAGVAGWKRGWEE
jgi:type IV pilus assembly protein PilE